MFNNYNEVQDNARKILDGACHVCPICDGKACTGQVPGCGSKGRGAGFIDCRKFFDGIKIGMDAVHEHFEPDTSVELFGKRFALPFCAAPTGGMKLNYGGKLLEEEFAKAVVLGCKNNGTFAWIGDGPDDNIFLKPLSAVKEAGGIAVTAIKPWDQPKAFARIKELEAAGNMAFGMDVDAAALINLKLAGKPVYTKSEAELKEIVKSTNIPFIVKGVLTPRAAERCAKAGCYGIVVSNHGGRIIEDAPVPASVLKDIKAAVGDSIKIFVDGGIRSGADIFKCLALGADEVMLARPFVTAVHGGKEEGVKLLIEKLASELKEIMLMTDCRTIDDINIDKIIL